MKLKKAAALALAFATATAICVPATALAADGDPTAGTPQDVTAANGTKSSAITGTIKPTTLKVSVPTVVSFDVDPGATAALAAPTAGNGYVSGQFKSPSNFTITNYSVVDVYGYVSGVAATGATLSQTGATAGTHASSGTGWTTEPAVQIVASDTKPADFSTATDWFDTTKTKKLYAFNETDKGKLAASADGTNKGGEATMYLFGQVAKTGWKTNDAFTVTPTFTIATADPGAETNS